MQNIHLLIMDSGAGGLSVAAEIRKRLPHATLSYLADHEFFPYGIRSETEIVERVTQLFGHIHRETPVDIAVVACNTASTVVLDKLRSCFPVRFVGVVPAVKPAAALTRSGVIGILATEGTINRKYTQQLIIDYASHCQVLLQGSQALVQLAENKLRGIDVSMTAIEAELACFRTGATVPDTVVLACTHFPLLKQEMMAALPEVLHWVDSGEAIARRVVHLAQEQRLANTCSEGGLNRLIVTGGGSCFYQEALVQSYLGRHSLYALSL